MAVRVPWATLIIPTYGAGGVDLVRQCLKSFRDTHPKTEPEIIIVSDGDEAAVVTELGELAAFHGAELIVNPRGGFSKACNAGLRKSNGHVTYLVNNDIEFIEPSLLMMNDAMTIHGAGIIGCRLLYPDQTIQHAGVCYVPNDKGPGFFDHRLRFEIASHPQALKCHSSLVTGALMGISRWYIEVVGLLDERFKFAVEDIDACLNAFEAGRDSLYFGYTAAIHHEGKTRGRTLEEKQARFPELIDQEKEALSVLQNKWVGLDWTAFA